MGKNTTPHKYIPDPKPELTDLYYMGPATAEKLREAGYETIQDIKEASEKELKQIEGVRNSVRTWKWQVENDEIGNRPPIFTGDIFQDG